jgi:phosphoenolpyruvate carboxykinase (ATP)
VSADGHPFAALVRERGGLPLVGPDLSAELADARFAAILTRGEETLPPIARLDSVQAAAWLLLAAPDPALAGAELAAARALADALGGRTAYLLTAGRVGGGPDEPRSREIPAALVARVLDADTDGAVEWECDPDFGYELPMELPDLAVEERRVLVPRFLYARTDRVYDYAAMVPRLKRERRRRLEASPELAAAVGA